MNYSEVDSKNSGTIILTDVDGKPFELVDGYYEIDHGESVVVRNYVGMPSTSAPRNTDCEVLTGNTLCDTKVEFKINREFMLEYLVAENSGKEASYQTKIITGGSTPIIKTINR